MINQGVHLGFEEESRKLKQLVKETFMNKLKELPLSLQTQIHIQCVLSGSSISSIYHGEAVKDYDLWFKDPRDIEPMKKLIIESYMSQVKSCSKEYGTDEMPLIKSADGQEKKYLITSNAITFNNMIQLILLADYQPARKDFDFLHCMPYYDLLEDKFFISQNQFDSIKHKKLVWNGNNIPKAYRMEKFKARGWSF